MDRVLPTCYPKGLLRHGQTGRVVLSVSLKNATVIPQRATFEVLGKRYVYVIGRDDVAHRREIVIQNELPDTFVIRKGLDVSDRIVVHGVERIHDGQKVKSYEHREPGPRAHPEK